MTFRPFDRVFSQLKALLSQFELEFKKEAITVGAKLIKADGTKDINGYGQVAGRTVLDM